LAQELCNDDIAAYEAMVQGAEGMTPDA
jgi:hypothetical protein